MEVRSVLIGGVTAAVIAAGVTAQLYTADTAAADSPPVALSGQVHHQGQGPVRLYAQLWPTDTILAGLQDGEEVPLVSVPVQVRGKSYTVRMDHGSIPPTHRSATGVNIQVIAVGADGTSDTYNETLQPPAGTGAAGWQRSRVATEALAESREALAESRGAQGLSMKALRAPGNLVLSGSSVSSLEASPSTTQALAESEPALTTSSSICGHYTDGSHNHRVKISDVMPAVNHMNGRVTYKQGSWHEIGIGLKTPAGAVSQSGTKTTKTTESVVPAWKASDYTAKTSWKFVDFVQTCSRNREARPVQALGGYYTPARDRPKYKNCKKYQPVETWSRVQYDAWTYGAGTSFWGINLTAQVGYDQETALQYSFPNRARWLCGNNTYPASAKLVAGYASDQR